MSILGRISELRKQHEKLSINKLEQECGLTRGSMAKWDDHAPSPDKVKKVADYFNVSVEYLLYGDPSAGIKKDPIPKDGAEGSAKQKLMCSVWAFLRFDVPQLRITCASFPLSLEDCRTRPSSAP